MQGKGSKESRKRIREAVSTCAHSAGWRTKSSVGTRTGAGARQRVLRLRLWSPMTGPRRESLHGRQTGLLPDTTLQPQPRRHRDTRPLLGRPRPRGGRCWGCPATPPGHAPRGRCLPCTQNKSRLLFAREDGHPQMRARRGESSVRLRRPRKH